MTYDGRMLIGGELVGSVSGRTYQSINPADESVVGEAADGQPEDVERAVTAARRAFDETDWSTNRALRRRCLEQLQAAWGKAVEDLRGLLLDEVGTPYPASLSSLPTCVDDMSFMIDMIDRFEWETEFGVYAWLGMRSNRTVRYEPYGVVGAISPWNAPFMTNTWKITHALAAGNTVVLKTAPDTPLIGAMMGRIALEETDLPPGVLNIISSKDKAVAGEALTGDPRVDMFSFTGSPGIGQRIMERAANGIRKVCLELGGKSANIVLGDADLDFALPYSAGFCMSNSGQGCALPTRILLPRSRYDECIERLTAVVAAIPYGSPREQANVVGPIVNRAQLERMTGLVETARAEGSRVTVGGRVSTRFDKGFWFEPTLVADVEPLATIAQTEVFGPVLAAIPYEDDEDAIRIANSTSYGLSAYIQSTDLQRAKRVADRMRAGTVNINNSFYLSPDTPFGGYGISGIGREHGVEGFREYVQAKTIASPDTATS